MDNKKEARTDLCGFLRAFYGAAAGAEAPPDPVRAARSVSQLKINKA
jgi:hypothetical protein